MKRVHGLTILVSLSLSAAAACSDGYGSNPNPVNPDLVPVTVFASGGIATKVDEFRVLLGEPSNGGAAGEQAAGRREITWDGAGANPFNNRNDFPATFFNTNVKSGVVFSDVDVAGTTKIEFFDASGARLATITAPARSDAAGLSFVGARFIQPIVARVRITLGNGSLGPTVKDISGGGATDLVVADNFIYGEPKRIQ